MILCQGSYNKQQLQQVVSSCRFTLLSIPDSWLNLGQIFQDHRLFLRYLLCLSPQSLLYLLGGCLFLFCLLLIVHLTQEQRQLHHQTWRQPLLVAHRSTVLTICLSFWFASAFFFSSSIFFTERDACSSSTCSTVSWIFAKPTFRWSCCSSKSDLFSPYSLTYACTYTHTHTYKRSAVTGTQRHTHTVYNQIESVTSLLTIHTVCMNIHLRSDCQRESVAKASSNSTLHMYVRTYVRRYVVQQSSP